jgi:hypothetical protein
MKAAPNSTPKPKRIPPCYVLMESGHAVAFTMNKPEAERWLMTDEQDYEAFTSFEAIPEEFKQSMLAERIRALASAITKCEEKQTHNKWQKNPLRRVLPEPKRPVMTAADFRMQTAPENGGAFMRFKGGPLHMLFAGIWPTTKTR